MGAILAISIFLIVVTSLAILRTSRPPSSRDAEQLPPGITPRGLFDDDGRGAAPAAAEDESSAKARAAALRARAERGDLEALGEAQAAGDAALYRFVLDGLVGHAAGSPDAVRALAAHIAGSDGLRSSPALAEMLLAGWRQAPSRSSTAELLRVSALSDDAGTFALAVSEVLQLWEEGRLPGIGAEELHSLFEGEYWLLSSEAKRSGSGFALKQKLAAARRRIAARARVGNTPTDAGSPRDVPAQKERP